MAQEKAKNHNLKAVPPLPDAATPLIFDEELSECPKCFNSGMEVLPEGARPCSCRNLDSKQQGFEAGLPSRYHGFHFGNYKPRSESQRVAREFAINLTTSYPAVDRGLLFMGSVGIGKTHLAVSILKGLRERGFSCLFY